jgi:hypothetical protein
MVLEIGDDQPLVHRVQMFVYALAGAWAQNQGRRDLGYGIDFVNACQDIREEDICVNDGRA